MPVAANGARETNWLDVDRLERRYRLVYPLHVFLENARQIVTVSAVALVVAACVYLLQHVLSPASEPTPTEMVFLVTAFASFIVVGYISLWDLTVRNFWKLGGLLSLTIALALGWALYATGTQAASSIADALMQLRTAAPIFAILFLAAIAFIAAYYAHLIWTLFAASFGLALVNASERKLLRDRPSRTTLRPSFWSRFWGFPILYRFARASPLRYAAIIALSLVSATLFSAVTVLPLIMNMPFDDFSGLSAACRGDLDCIKQRVFLALNALFLPLALFAACIALGWLAQRLLRRLLRFSLEALQEVDTRPPVLFLRAFRDDQVPLRAPRIALFGRVLEIGRRSNSLDQLLLEEGTVYGPVVGLGSPTDKRPPYGAARGYYSAETWQGAVTSLAAQAAFIVICIDDTAGVWWEVERLVGRHLDKTLFLIHPRYANAAENAFILGRLAQYFQDQEARALRTRLQGQEWQRPSVTGFFRDQDARLCIFQTSTFSRFAYLMTLRSFARQRSS